MNTQKPTRRVLSRILSLVMALAMVCSLFAIRISAAKADFTAPTKATAVDKNYITVSAHSQAFLLPEIIGLSNTTSRNTELPDVFAKNADDTQTTMSLKEAQKTAILGVFGSPINEEPNPYMYNYFYNAYITFFFLIIKVLSLKLLAYYLFYFIFFGLLFSTSLYKNN